MNPETFGDEYMKAVMEFMERVKNNIRTITEEGREWIIHTIGEDPVCCITPARCYRLPPEIIELLKMDSVHKLYAYKLKFKLNMNVSRDIMYVYRYDGTPWFNASICTCDDPITYDRWAGDGEYSICEKCYNNLDNPELYKKTNIWELNMLDWACFMYELSEYDVHPSDSHRYNYYVNCNVDSPDYGKILYMNIGSEQWANTIGYAADLISHIGDWFIYESQDEVHDSERYLEICEYYLTDKFGTGFESHLFNTWDITNEYVLRHRDDVYTPGMVDLRAYIDLLSADIRYRWKDTEDIEACAKRKISESIGTKVFSDRNITRVVNNLLNRWYYLDGANCSFSNYMH
jgi:hypothetical protein